MSWFKSKIFRVLLITLSVVGMLSQESVANELTVIKFSTKTNGGPMVSATYTLACDVPNVMVTASSGEEEIPCIQEMLLDGSLEASCSVEISPENTKSRAEVEKLLIVVKVKDSPQSAGIMSFDIAGPSFGAKVHPEYETVLTRHKSFSEHLDDKVRVDFKAEIIDEDRDRVRTDLGGIFKFPGASITLECDTP